MEGLMVILEVTLEITLEVTLEVTLASGTSGTSGTTLVSRRNYLSVGLTSTFSTALIADKGDSANGGEGIVSDRNRANWGQRP